MTATAHTTFTKRIDTRASGFQAVQLLAQRADAGIHAVVSVETRLFEATGLTTGIVEYLERHGVPTDHLAEDYRRRGPRSDPEHLYLTDVLVEYRDGKLHTRPVMRVRVPEVVTCWC